MTRPIKGFWAELLSGDNSKVNTMAVVSIVLAAPVVLLSTVALVYHVFLLNRGLDSSSVQLLIALLTAATGGLGASMFSRSIMGRFGGGPYGPGEDLPLPHKKPRPPIGKEDQ